MAEKLVIFALLIPFIAFGALQIHLLEVDPDNFACHHQKQIKGDPDDLFQFITSPYALEKLLPWLSRFKEADKRIVSAGKSYTAIMWVPILGERRFYAVLTDYHPSRSITFEFSDILRQRIVIQTSSYHDRILLKTTVYFRRTSLIYHYTIGYALRAVMKNQLEQSMKNLAAIFESLDGPDKIPDFSRKNK